MKVRSFNYRRSLTAIALSAFASLGIAVLALPAGAQTPTSTVYAYTNLNNLVDLGIGTVSSANGVAGSVAVGSGLGNSTNDQRNALRWNADGTVTNLHTFANLGDNSSSYALGISNGVTVGYGHGDNIVGVCECAALERRQQRGKFAQPDCRKWY